LTSSRWNEKRVLAIDPASRGFGFAILEGPPLLIDWGVKNTTRDKKAKSLALTQHLIKRYQPDLLVLEDFACKGSRRRKRIRDLIAAIQKLAQRRGPNRTLTYLNHTATSRVGGDP
jgi:RNase H-fold protein (predicted Holliday junction resolvase)